MEVAGTIGWILGSALVGALSLAVAAWVVPGIRFDGYVSLFLAALLLGVLSIVQVLVPPLIGLPMPLVGLAGILLRLVVSALLLWLVGTIIPGFEVDGFVPALMGALVMTAFGWILSTLLFFTAMPGVLAPR